MARKTFEPSRVRTLALVGHRSSGKTSLGDLLLKLGRVTRTVGRVELGTSLLDHDARARRHRMTVKPAFAWFEWGDALVHLVDVPGAAPCAYRAAIAVRGVDAVCVVIDAAAGVERGTERAFAHARFAGVPVMVAISRLDAVGGFDGWDALGRAAGARVVPLQLPLLDAGRLVGVVDLLSRVAYRFSPDGEGDFSPEPVPGAMVPAMEAAREHLSECVALADDALLERYLEEFDLPDDVVRAGLASGMRGGVLVPAVLTSATAGVGGHQLLDALVALAPPPREVGTDGVVAQVVSVDVDADGAECAVLRVWRGDLAQGGALTNVRTGANTRVRKLYQLRGDRRAAAFHSGPGALVGTWDALAPRAGDTLVGKGADPVPLPTPPPPPRLVARRVVGTRDQARVRAALERLVRYDPSLHIGRDPSGDAVLEGTSEEHVELALEALRECTDAAVSTAAPTVDFREVPLRLVRGVRARWSEEVAGLREGFGEVEVDLEPTDPDDEGDVVIEVDDEDVPARFHGGIEDGVRAALEAGPLAGLPLAGVRVVVTGGRYDMLVSKPEHFGVAAERAVREALLDAGTRVVEPWSSVRVHVPTDDVGAVLAELAQRGGRIGGLEFDAGEAAVVVAFPERDVHALASRLHRVTGGRGWFERSRAGRAPVPDDKLRDVLAQVSPAPRAAAPSGGLVEVLHRPRAG